MYVVNRVLLTPIVFESSLDLSPGADRFAHVDEGSEPTRVSSNSRFFDLYSPRALYRCFWKQQGHVLCYSTMVLGQPTGLLVHGRWLLELICQPGGGGGRKVKHVSFFPLGCEYGDRYKNCEDLVYPYACYHPENARACCWICSQYRNASRPGWYPFLIQ